MLESKLLRDIEVKFIYSVNGMPYIVLY